MKYEVLQSFRGSPDGRYAVDYAKGETVELSQSLAEVALTEGWVRPAGETVTHERENKRRKK